MKKYTAILSQFLVVGIFIFSGFAAGKIAAQDLFSVQTEAVEEVRPFDFSDKFYRTNGIEPSMIINRRTGADDFSVIDFIKDDRFRGVRITGTYPAYDPSGNILYWNHYGDLYEESFTQDREGNAAKETANYYPIFKFPSETVKNYERQAALIAFDENYFEKNPLGLGVIVEVEFTELVRTKEGRIILEAIARENGLSLDGTPIIKRMKEMNYLARRGLIRQTVRGTNDKSETPFVIAKVLDNVERGAISPDSFLTFVRQPNSTLPLPAEEDIVSNFECLKDKDSCGKE